MFEEKKGRNWVRWIVPVCSGLGLEGVRKSVVALKPMSPILKANVALIQ